MSPKFPSNTLAKAFASAQTTFDDEIKPVDDGLAFFTRVRDPPVQVLGRPGPDVPVAN
jgi:hypothetical protein